MRSAPRPSVLGLVLVVIAGVGSCGGAPDAGAVLAAHHAPFADPGGAWTCAERGLALEIGLAGPGRLRVRCMDGLTAEETEATLADGVLALERPLAGSARWHLCRFGDEVVLVSETPELTFEGGADALPAGAVFRRPRDLPALKAFSPGPEDEVPPMRRGADH